MNVITGKHLPRRTFLRGLGGTVALPYLDAMVPAGLYNRSAAGDPTRLVCIEEVHGLAGCNAWGDDEHLFAPATVGRDWELVPENVLKPLEGWREHMTIVSNTDCRMAESFAASEIGGDHFRSSAVFLSHQHPKQTQGSDIYAGKSLDQIYADRFGGDTPIPSLQLAIESVDSGGGCWYNYHCAYTDSISWMSATQPLPGIRDPRVAFDQLFGAGGSKEERAVRRRTNQSILDWIAGEVAQLRREVGLDDRRRMDRYLTDVRELEQRIQALEALNTSGEARELPDAPPGVPDSYSEHMQLMFDLQVLAFETDMTRVVSFKTGRDASNRVFPESGTDRTFHSGSHHGGNPEAILEFNKINSYRLSMLDYFLKKLHGSIEGDKNLLEKTVVLWGSPMADANLHNHRRCPLILFGKGNGALTGNLHVKAPDGTPMANAMLALLHELGHDDMESFGDSTYELPLRYTRAPSVTSSAG